MKSALEEIRAIIYSNRSEEEILDGLKSYIALGHQMGSVLTSDTVSFFIAEEDWKRVSKIPFLSAGLSISSSWWFGSAPPAPGRPCVGHFCA